MSTGPGDRLAFAIAGVQKAGTSALFDYLREVPGLQLSEGKELHFFDDEEGVDWSAPDYDLLHRHFDSDGRAWGEATPITLYWPNALERLHAYNPEVRLILIFRDPVARAYSHWQMEFARGKETEPFGWCIRDGRARMAEGTPYPGFHRVYSYVERGFYGRQLARALRLFARDRILLLRSDELASTPDETIARVCAFLGVAPPPAPLQPRVVRAAPAIAYPAPLSDEDRAFLAKLYRPELARFDALAGPERSATSTI